MDEAVAVRAPAERREHARASSRLAVWIAVAMSALGVALVGLAPLSQSETDGVGIDGTAGSVSASESVFAAQGPAALIAACVPLALAGIALMFTRSQRFKTIAAGSAAATLAFVLLAGFSVGFLFFPAAVALVVASVRAP